MRLRLAFLLALFLPELPLDPLRADLGCSWSHPLGTDALGRDGLLRLLQAGGRSLGFASAVALGALALGTALALGEEHIRGARSALKAVPPLLLLLPLAALCGGLGWLPLGLLLVLLQSLSLEAPLRARLDPFRRGPAWTMNRVLGGSPWHQARVWAPWALREAGALFPAAWLEVIWAESTLRLLGLGPGPHRDSLGMLLNEELPRLSTDPTPLGLAALALVLGLSWSATLRRPEVP